MNTTTRRTAAEMLAEMLAERNVHDMTAKLKSLEAEGKTDEFNTLFPVYVEKFRNVFGYRPHWSK